MTNILQNNSSLKDIISENNISLDFLKSSLGNESYHNLEFNYDNLFWKFSYAYDNFFHLLQKSEKELLELRVVGKTTIDKLRIFLSEHNCSIGMFSDFTNANLHHLTGDKIKIDDLTPDEKTLSLTMIKHLSITYANDMELGREIRKIFNTIQS
jgi:hypothetical protein